MENPSIVPDAWSYPGACALTGTADGPFIDTGQELSMDGRCFIHVNVARELGRIAGLPSEELLAEVVEARDTARDALEMAAAQIEELTERLTKLEKLRNCVAYTLSYGVVNEGPRKGRLRAPPKLGTADIDALVAEADD